MKRTLYYDAFTCKFTFTREKYAAPERYVKVLEDPELKDGTWSETYDAKSSEGFNSNAKIFFDDPSQYNVKFHDYVKILKSNFEKDHNCKLTRLREIEVPSKRYNDSMERAIDLEEYNELLAEYYEKWGDN